VITANVQRVVAPTKDVSWDFGTSHEQRHDSLEYSKSISEPSSDLGLDVNGTKKSRFTVDTERSITQDGSKLNSEVKKGRFSVLDAKKEVKCVS
jgi:hypothetical protein